MDPQVLQVFGGIGLFLLGMIILTDGLRALAGGALRRVLARSTDTPLKGAVLGAGATALIQSSSATTVTAVGLVGAGLLTFPQGLGIVFGANIGTTVTGWMVAILGFKVKLGLVVLPLLFLGVLLRLFAGGRLRQIGWAIAGFSLLFIGIDAMQQGMAQFEGRLTPADFPGDDLLGRLQLVLLGVVVTLVTQSSSAGVATALVALHAGTISFPQAAAMVIGMDIGTTFTAVLATLGGSTASRRTGYGHVIYNLGTGLLAFFLLGPFSTLVAPWTAAGGAQFALVAFHTGFNIVGVILALTVAGPFARVVTRLVPERGPPLLRRLDTRQLRDPATAVDTAVATVRDIADLQIAIVADLLDPARRLPIPPARVAAVAEAVAATRTFVAGIRTSPSDPNVYARHLATMHTLDHLDRLADRCSQRARIDYLRREPRLRRLAAVLRGTLLPFAAAGDTAATAGRADRVRTLLRRQRRVFRARTVAAAATQRIDADTVLSRLDSVRWLHRVAYHIWRILHHLQVAAQEAPPAPSASGAASETMAD